MKTLGFESPVSEVVLCDGWTLHTVDTIDSTNNAAGELPGWHALRARTQTAGRGRTGRQWVSDVGGLWLSATMPCEADEPCWQFLPLAVGWALIEMLRRLEVSNIRLRWPNDLMVGRRKLAGILVERFSAHTVVVGLGLNVFNSPGIVAPELSKTTTRLADLTPSVGSLEEVARWMLQAIRRAHHQLATEGFSSMVATLNTAWAEPTPVELTLAGQVQPVQGEFVGVDWQGRLRLSRKGLPTQAYDANQVALLTELD